MDSTTESAIKMFHDKDIALFSAQNAALKHGMRVRKHRAREFYTFIRSMQEGGFQGLHKNTRYAVNEIETRGLMYGKTAPTARMLKVHHKYIYFAKLFLSMEKAGAFEKIESFYEEC